MTVTVNVEVDVEVDVDVDLNVNVNVNVNVHVNVDVDVQINVHVNVNVNVKNKVDSVPRRMPRHLTKKVKASSSMVLELHPKCRSTLYNVHVNVNVNVNDVSLQPSPTQPRRFELFASVRGGGQYSEKPLWSSPTKCRHPTSVRASASACKRPACKNVGGMSACRRHVVSDEFASSSCSPSMCTRNLPCSNHC